MEGFRDPKAIMMEAAPAHPIINDPFLLSILQTSAKAREQAFDILSAIEDGATALDLSAQQKILYAHLANLRGQNRRLAHVVRATKSSTAESRTDVDTLHLSLQNLYYEEQHLLGEIEACDSYPHAYASLPLISKAEFFDTFPDMRESDEEALTRARIKHEGSMREGLEEQRTALAKRKQELVAENAKRKEELGRLDKDLEAFIDVCYDFPGSTCDLLTSLGCETNPGDVRKRVLIHEPLSHHQPRATDEPSDFVVIHSQSSAIHQAGGYP